MASNADSRREASLRRERVADETRVGDPVVGAPSQARVLKVFLSYSRRDMAVAERLVSLLEERGMEVLIDRRDLPYGEEWQAELADFIRMSDTVVWLVSPDSIASKWVNWELGEVGRLSKRMVPVRIREIDPEGLPELLGKIHLLRRKAPSTSTGTSRRSSTPSTPIVPGSRSPLGLPTGRASGSPRTATRVSCWLAGRSPTQKRGPGRNRPRCRRSAAKSWSCC